ncbi:unnamed protein product [Cercopithifilaria johnstoni]|uniref:Uncharacterized protein n=1 Tax=Cercopithifilaria johnstoni TaxID=2874296 RepID=A0A8J2Q409_9BILA|nr:unnamed protein product [Cercopithifilaria johnstoni]
MGCSRSRIYHDTEVGIDHKDLKLTTFERQTDDIVFDLDTDNDQRGRIAVDCIFRPTREIYGQRASDMIEQQLIVWSKYEFEGKIHLINSGIKFRKRPFPHDFPAFAHEKPAAELAQLSRLHLSNQLLQTPAESTGLTKIRETSEKEIIEDIAKKK